MPLRPDLLRVHLNDQLALATGAAALARRAAASAGDAPLRAGLREAADGADRDRAALAALMGRLGVTRTLYKESFALLAERVGRLKPNGRLRRRSPLSTAVELEGLLMLGAGTAACWRALQQLASGTPALDAGEFAGLAEHAEQRLDTLRRLHAAAVVSALTGQAQD